jgi:hypothetical protein
MTIILQYQFWDLRVDDVGFEVGLHFKNVPERLCVPYEAISGFYDPSVQFGLKFETQVEGEDGEEIEADDDDSVIELGPVANPPRLAVRDLEKKPRESEPKPALAADKSARKSDAPDSTEPAGVDASKVVSIDAFRKKT